MSLLAIAAAVSVPGNRLGLGILIVGFSFALFLSTLPVERDLWHAAFMSSGLLLLGAAAVRDASWIVVPATFGGALCLVFAALPPQRVTHLLRGGFTFFRLIEGSRSATEVIATAVPSDAATRLKPLLRALAVGLPLVAFFGALLASADQAFAHLAGEVMFVDVDVTLIPLRIAVAGWALAIAGALHAGTTRPLGTGVEGWSGDPWSISTPQPKPSAPRSVVEWALPLGLLNLLFAAFVAVQFAVLFGGRSHVLRTTGLSYAEYARSGFFQLLAVAGLVLIVMAAARRLVIPATSGENRVLQVLLTILALSSLVILTSALYRLGLYEDAYGLSRARYGARWFMFWLAALLVMAIVRAFTGVGPWLVRMGALAAAATLLFAVASDPDAAIAKASVERFESSGEIDIFYVTSLSADAVPDLLRLPDDIASCVLDPHLALLTQDDAWGGWNLSRATARAGLVDSSIQRSGSFPCSAPVQPR